MKKYLTVQDLMNLLHVSRRSIYRYIQKNEIAFAIKINGLILFPEEDVKKYIDRKIEGDRYASNTTRFLQNR